MQNRQNCYGRKIVAKENNLKSEGTSYSKAVVLYRGRTFRYQKVKTNFFGTVSLTMLQHT